MSSRKVGSSVKRLTAAAISSGDRPATNIPLRPCSITSTTPPASVVTKDFPIFPAVISQLLKTVSAGIVRVVSLAKAEEFLRTAQRCVEEGWYNSAASRAYYAMFHAVQAALANVGITRPWWSHGSLHATLSGELVRRRKLYPFSFVRAITEALELRHTADYSDHWVPARRVKKAVNAATEILKRVKEVTGNA